MHIFTNFLYIDGFKCCNIQEKQSNPRQGLVSGEGGDGYFVYYLSLVVMFYHNNFITNSKKVFTSMESRKESRNTQQRKLDLTVTF